MDSIYLPHCWVCGVRFTDSRPPGPANREEHHIIPRQAGGSDGPTVSLCDGHHTCLHKIALCLKSKRPYFDLVTGESDDSKKKLYWLATTVFNAFEATKNDPNKQVMTLMSLDRRQQIMIDRLRGVYPRLKSREALINLALESLYKKHFTE
jgi:hypothetical protein